MPWKNKIKVVTRSCNEALYLKMRAMLPDSVPCERITGFNGYEEAFDYLWHVLQATEWDYIVNIDEDCFVFNWDEVLSIINLVEERGYTHSGMPDGGQCSHRNSWPQVHNPFFNVFNIGEIKKILPDMSARQKTAIRKMKLDAVNAYLQPYHKVRAWKFSEIPEPFNGLFFYLYSWGLPLDLQAQDHADGISTVLKGVTGEPFALHSWYSREYREPMHRERINRLYAEAQAG